MADTEKRHKISAWISLCEENALMISGSPHKWPAMQKVSHSMMSSCLKMPKQKALQWHHNDNIMITSQITGILIVCSTICSGEDQNIHQSSASLTFVRGIHRWPVDSPHKGPVMWKMFPFDDVIMDWPANMFQEHWQPLLLVFSPHATSLCQMGMGSCQMTDKTDGAEILQVRSWQAGLVCWVWVFVKHAKCYVAYSQKTLHILPMIWCHQTFCTSLALYRGNPAITDGFLSQKDRDAESWWFICH